MISKSSCINRSSAARKIRFLFLLVIPFALTGCFEVLENVVLKNDGSGQFKYIVNFSQSKSKIDLLIEQGEVEGYAIPPKNVMRKKFEQSLEEAADIDGIIEPKGKFDLDNYIIEFSCSFRSLNDLNKAADEVKAKNEDLDQDNFVYFTYDSKKKTFLRKGDNLLKDQYNKMSKAQRMIFSGAYYTCIYRFESEIDTILSINSKISKNRRTSFQKLPVTNITGNGAVLNHEIKLK